MCRLNGEKIMELRKATKTSQVKLAEALGVHHTTVSSYEIGKTGATDENARKIANYFGVPVEEILSTGENKGRRLIQVRKKSSWNKNMTPAEVEDVFNAKREELGLTEEKELASVANAYNTKTVRGQSTEMFVKPEWIHYPLWQRNLSPLHAKTIGTFNADLYDDIRVFIKEGKVYVADGGHRCFAFLSDPNIEWLNAKVIDGENAEQRAMDLFSEQGRVRRSPSAADIWRANIEAEIPQYIEFRDLCIRNGIQIEVDYERVPNRKGTINPSFKMLRRFTENPIMFEKAIRLIDELNWYGATTKSVYTYANICVVMKLLAKYAFNEKTFRERMKTVYGGAENYEKGIAGNKEAVIFDKVSKVVDNYLKMEVDRKAM